MSTGGYTPGDSPLGNVRTTTGAKELLGGRPLDSINPGEVLTRFKVGAFEAGLVKVPIYGYLAFRATNGSFRNIWLSPPVGFTWRVLAASAFILDAATQAPAMGSGPLSVVVIPAGSPETPEVSGAGTGNVPTLATPAAPIILASSVTGPASYEGTFHIQNPDQIAAYGSEPAGDEIYISVLYSEFPLDAVPPR